jgi:hypothetical protein
VSETEHAGPIIVVADEATRSLVLLALTPECYARLRDERLSAGGRPIAAAQDRATLVPIAVIGTQNFEDERMQEPAMAQLYFAAVVQLVDDALSASGAAVARDATHLMSFRTVMATPSFTFDYRGDLETDFPGYTARGRRLDFVADAPPR